VSYAQVIGGYKLADEEKDLTKGAVRARINNVESAS